MLTLLTLLSLPDLPDFQTPGLLIQQHAGVSGARAIHLVPGLSSGKAAGLTALSTNRITGLLATEGVRNKVPRFVRKKMQVLRELDSLVERKAPDDARYPCSG